MEKTLQSQTVLELLHDKVFGDLYHAVNEDALSWREFQSLPMPYGYTAEETWKIIAAIRRHNSHHIGLPSYAYGSEPVESWCTVGTSFASMLRDLHVRARMLDTISDETGDLHRYALTEMMARDLAAALERDGHSLDLSVVTELVVGDRSPATPVERLITNTAGLLYELERYVRHRISPWMLEEFSQQIDKGCSQLISAHPARYQVSKGYATYASRQSTEQSLDQLCAVLGRCSMDSPDVFVIDAVFALVSLWDFAPLHKWNGLVEVVARHLVLTKIGLSSLRCVPFSEYVWRWEQTGDAYHSVDPDVGEGFDCTRWARKHLTLILEGTYELDGLIARRFHETKPLSDVIDACEELNARQRSVIKDLVLHPHRALRIDGYMKLHRVAYATARQDLLDLARKGFLNQTYAGRAMVFTADCTLEARLQDRCSRG